VSTPKPSRSPLTGNKCEEKKKKKALVSDKAERDIMEETSIAQNKTETERETN